MKNRIILLLLAFAVDASLCPAAPPTPIFDEEIDSPMYQLPPLPAAPVEVVQHIDVKLWLHALEQPEAEIKCKVAESIILAHERHVPGLETTIEPLLTTINQPQQHPTVILAVARSLVALDARKSADSLFRHTQAGGNDLRSTIEPALARWNYQPAQALWLDRLLEPTTPRGSLLLAIDGLATGKNLEAVQPLKQIIFDTGRLPTLRLAAARALGMLRESGLEEDATRLTSEMSMTELVARLAAASILQQHKSEQAIQILQRLVRDPEPAVAILAVQRLLVLDPKYLLSDVETHILKSSDASLRLLGVKTLHRQPTKKHLQLLASHLDDREMHVRVHARKSLHNLAKDKQFRPQIIEDVSRILDKDAWRGQMQSAILLSQLAHKPAAGRLVELLQSNREEVQIAAAWGLRMLNVPDTLDAVVLFIAEEPKKHAPSKARPGASVGPPPTSVGVIDHVLSQLNQFVGQQRYKPADAVLRRYIRKHYMGNEARASAIWALGKIHERDMRSDDALIDALEERLADVGSIPPEDMCVRWMSAIALGRLKAKKSLPTLQASYPSKRAADDPVNNASGWAIEQLNGEKMAPPLPVRKVQRDWFLVPNKKT